MLLAEVAAVAEGKPPSSAVASAADIAAQGGPPATDQEGTVTEAVQAKAEKESGEVPTCTHQPTEEPAEVGVCGIFSVSCVRIEVGMCFNVCFRC